MQIRSVARQFATPTATQAASMAMVGQHLSDVALLLQLKREPTVAAQDAAGFR